MHLALICPFFSVISVVLSRHSVCPPESWGPPYCEGECHCDSGEVACREDDGHCTIGICAVGFTGMPACRTSCIQGRFGPNCMYTCHCQEYDTCSSINGLCDSGFCQHGYAGPACQTRLPILSSAVELHVVTDRSITVAWRQWNPNIDPGVGPIVYYLLEYQSKKDGNNWTEATTVFNSTTDNIYVYPVHALEAHTFYRFRITLGYVMHDKWIRSVPGEPSEWYHTLPNPGPTTITMPSTNATAITTTITTTTTTKINTAVTERPTKSPNSNVRPVTVHLLFRDQTTLRVDWRLTSSKFKWCWKAYKVTLALLASGHRRKRDIVNEDKVVETSDTQLTFHNLNAASQYEITVESKPEKDIIPFIATLAIWTLTENIQPPPVPNFVNATETTLTMSLFGVADQIADIKSYQVIVENMTAVQQTNGTPLSVAVAAGLSLDAAVFYGYSSRFQNKHHPETYVTAKFHENDLQRYDGMVFQVGDGETYGSFYNVPLEKTSAYVIWVLAEYRYKGAIVSQMARSKDAYVPAMLATKPKGSGHLHLGYIIAIAVLAFLFVVAGIVIYAMYIKRNEEKMKYFTKFRLFRRRDLTHDETTQVPGSPHSPTKYKPRRSLYEELDFSANGPPIHVPNNKGLVTDSSYIAMRNSNPIKVDKLKQYSLDREATDYSISEEYRHLPIGLIDTVHAATKPNNALLNRTSHILPYDTNRIKVKSIVPGGEGHDYINASLIKTHMHTFYVVTQCPMNTTMGEFWRMVWEQEVSVIVALIAMDEPDKPEYKAYWPKIDDHPLLYHDVRVSCNGSERSAHYVIRTFYISRLVHEREEIRVVRHYQFVTWTKTGVPKYTAPFLDFYDRFREGHAKNPKSILVHCHSGGGRSGMFVALDALIKEGQQKGQVDVLKCVTKLRQERPNMVKHLRQYKFVYEALIDYFLCSECAVDAHTFPQKYSGMNTVNKNMNNARTPLALEFETMEYIKNLPQTPRLSSRSILRDHNQPFVSPMKKSASFRIGDSIVHPNEAVTNSIFSAQIDSFSERNTFIILRHPQQDQVVEFWDTVIEKHGSTIVSLNSIDKDVFPTQYLPEPSTEDGLKPWLLHIGDFTVSVSEDPVETDAYQATHLVVYPTEDPPQQMEQQPSNRSIKHFEFTNWMCHNDAPAVKHMLTLIQSVRQWKNESDGAVIVHSNRGCNRATMFCLLWSMFERIDMEGQVNLFRAVLHHRKFEETAIYNASQYRFLYQCINDYIAQYAPHNDQVIKPEDIDVGAGEVSLCRHLDDAQLRCCMEDSPSVSEVSATVHQLALNQTMDDLGAWFSNAEASKSLLSQDRTLDMPDLDDEDLELQRKTKFEESLKNLFRVK